MRWHAVQARGVAPPPLLAHAGAMIGCCRLAVFGGWGGGAGARGLQSRLWLLDTSSWRWRSVPPVRP
jgi:hypothetical protein